MGHPLLPPSQQLCPLLACTIPSRMVASDGAGEWCAEALLPVQPHTGSRLVCRTDPSVCRTTSFGAGSRTWVSQPSNPRYCGHRHLPPANESGSRGARACTNPAATDRGHVDTKLAMSRRPHLTALLTTACAEGHANLGFASAVPSVVSAGRHLASSPAQAGEPCKHPVRRTPASLPCKHPSGTWVLARPPVRAP